MDTKIIKDLIAEAIKARKKAYAPCSNVEVGAAILMLNDKIYSGYNVENALYGTDISAERAAITKAIGDSTYGMRGIAIVGGPAGHTPDEFYCPSKNQRQMIHDFSIDSCVVIIAKNINEYKVYTTAEFRNIE